MLLGEVSGEVMPFQALPESLDRIEVGTVGWQTYRLDMMPTQYLGLVPAGVVQHEQPPFFGTLGHLLGHRIKENPEDRRIAIGDDQAHQLAACGIDRADDILPHVAIPDRPASDASPA
jgi:hypothetical protein